MSITFSFRTFAFTSLSFCLCLAVPGEALLVGNWNVNNRPNTAGDSTDLSTINGFISSALGTPDIWAIQETDTGSTQTILGLFNNDFAGATYQGFESPSDGGSDRTALIYNTQSVELVSSSITTVGLTHFLTQGTFRSLTDPDAGLFDVVSVHLKSGTGSSNINQRRDEAVLIRDALAGFAGEHTILAGDFNMAGSNEFGSSTTNTAWDVFTAAGDDQLLDVVDAPGDWRDNAAYLGLHTQNPSSSLDDRFDMQFASTSLLDSIGLDYIEGSYTVLGNNGTHQLNGSILTGTGADLDTLTALTEFSDHLPVFATYGIVPEPTTAMLLAGLPAFLLIRRRYSA